MKGITNFWKNADTVQKAILIIGLTLSLGIVIVYIPKLQGSEKVVETPASDSLAVATTDFDVGLEIQEENLNFRKNTLDEIRKRQDLVREKDKTKERYGFGTEYFKSEFNIDTTENQEVVETIPKPEVQEDRPKVIYVQTKAPTPVVEEPKKPVLRRNKRLGSTEESSDDISVGKQYFNAVVHGDHYVGSRELIIMRTTESIEYEGLRLPPNSYIRGIINYSANRVSIEITSIGKEDFVTDISVSVYDKTDRQEGIPIRQLGSQEVKQNVASDLVEEVARDVNVPGIRSLRRGSRRAIQEQKVNILNGHKVLIGFTR